MQSGSGSHLSVVIPFYQRDQGILARALQSVFAQGLEDLDVIVIDDASPMPPGPDIATLPDAARKQIRVIAQTNQGPGGARNTGLGAVRAETRYVAFLDSDDTWEPGHLSDALALLAGERTAFYFSNCSGWGGVESHFAAIGFHPLGPTPEGLPPHLRLFEGDFFQSILESWPVHASTVVFDRAAFGDVRFDVRLRTAAEDQLFWLECANRHLKVGVSDRIAARLGTGVNIFRGNVRGSKAYSERCTYQMLYHKIVEKRFHLSGKSLAVNNRHLNINRREFIRSEFSAHKTGATWHPDLFREWLRYDPFFLKALPIVIIAACRNTLAGRN